MIQVGRESTVPGHGSSVGSQGHPLPRLSPNSLLGTVGSFLQPRLVLRVELGMPMNTQPAPAGWGLRETLFSCFYTWKRASWRGETKTQGPMWCTSPTAPSPPSLERGRALPYQPGAPHAVRRAETPPLLPPPLFFLADS